MTYETTTLPVGVQVRMAVADYIASVRRAKSKGRDSFSKLSSGILGSLCCPSTSGDTFKVPETTTFQRGSARDCLPGLIAIATEVLPFQIARMGSMLSGIHRARCFEACLNDDNIYALAAAICYFCETVKDDDKLDSKTTPDILSLLNQWVRPQEAWEELPGSLEIAQSLFGLAWCEFAYPGAKRERAGASDTSDMTLVCYAILQERPQFMPGRYPAQDLINGLPLPSLEMAP